MIRISERLNHSRYKQWVMMDGRLKYTERNEMIRIREIKDKTKS